MLADKRDVRSLFYVYTGHGPWNMHLTRIGIKEDPKCPYCKEIDDTVEHFIEKCPALVYARNQVWGVFIAEKDDILNHEIDSTDVLTYLQITRRFKDN